MVILPAATPPACASGKVPAEEVLMERRERLGSWLWGCFLGSVTPLTLSVLRDGEREGPPAVCAAAGDCLL